MNGIPKNNPEKLLWTVLNKNVPKENKHNEVLKKQVKQCFSP